MATYRYFNVRRDIYEKCSSKKLQKTRSFDDMKRLFKVGYWIMLIAMIVCALLSAILFFVFYNSFWFSIPILGMIVISIVSELFGSKMYNAEARKKELEEHCNSLDEYTREIKRILENHKIDSKAKRDALKKECEEQIELHNNIFKAISNKIYDMLIGVPLGALVSALIYQSEDNNVVVSIVGLILIGLMIIGIAGIIKKVAYYSEGHFKDQYLLNVLNELEYLCD